MMEEEKKEEELPEIPLEEEGKKGPGLGFSIFLGVVFVAMVVCLIVVLVL